MSGAGEQALGSETMEEVAAVKQGKKHTAQVIPTKRKQQASRSRERQLVGSGELAGLRGILGAGESVSPTKGKGKKLRKSGGVNYKA